MISSPPKLRGDLIIRRQQTARKSFRYVGILIERLFGLGPQTPVEVSRSERRIFLSYGLVAGVGSFCLLAYIIVTLSGYLIESSQPMLLMLSSGLPGMRFRQRFRKLFGTGADSSDPSDDGKNFETPNSAGSPQPAERRRNRDGARVRLFIWTALAGATLAVLFLCHMELRIAGPLIVLPIENADTRAEVDGTVEQICVDEGDKVKKGDVVARLSDRVLRSELQKVESDLAAKRARLQMLVAGPRAEEIALARKAVETANTRLKQARDLYTQAERSRDQRLALTETAIKKAEERLQFGQKNLEMYQTLVKEELGSRMQLDQAAEEVAVRKRELEEARTQKQVLLADDLAQARTNVAVAEMVLKEAEGRLQVLLAGTRREEIQELEAEIERSETEQAFLRGELARIQIVSAAAGIIATPSRQLKELRGQLVKQGDLIAKVYDLKTVTAQIVISEKEIAPIKVGQTVALRTRAHPDQSFYGTVTSIATSAQASSGGQSQTATSPLTSASVSTNKTILVTTQIDNHSLLLKPEMTGQAKVFCGHRRIIDLITWRAVRAFKVDVWSWW